MGTTCAAYGCTNRGKKGSTVRFHKFPSIKRADLRKKWTLAMKRKDFSPSGLYDFSQIPKIAHQEDLP